MGNAVSVSESFKGLLIDSLQSGDLIFSTTEDSASSAIRLATGGAFSHAAIYFRDGVIIEANDNGVYPRRISPRGLDAAERIVGVPYDDWSDCAVLRSSNSDPEESWARAITVALREHVGMDFPPLSRIARAARRPARVLVRPVAWILDLLDLTRGREPLAYDAWCSKLIGLVLLEQFGSRLTATQRKSLYEPSPQELLDIAKELGYKTVDAWVSAHPSCGDAEFESARRALADRQIETFNQWMTIATSRRRIVYFETAVRTLRSLAWIAKGFLIVLVLALLVAMVYFKTESEPWEYPGSIVVRELVSGDACAFRPIKQMGWTEGHKTIFCRIYGYGGGNVNEGVYKNGGVCVRGPEPDVCEKIVKGWSKPDIECTPNGVETICRHKTG
jgi:hypothetical protein